MYTVQRIRFTIKPTQRTVLDMTQKNKVYPMAMVAVMAAVMAVVAPFALPIGPVPISLATLVVYLTVYVLGWKRGTLATLVYILLGVVGMPVFSGFTGGLGKVMGPTGGYIIGYLPLALLAGLFVERFPERRTMQLVGMLLGTAVLYALGTAWFCQAMDSPLGAALSACVIPFLPGDLVKIVVSMLAGPVLRSRLRRAGLCPQA